MTHNTYRVAALGFGAALMFAGAVVAAQESGSEKIANDAAVVEDTAAAQSAIEAAGARADAVGEKVDALGAEIDRAASGVPAAAGVAAELDPNLEVLLRHREQMARMKSPPKFEDGAVAILVPIGFFAMVVLMVFLPLFMRNRRRKTDAEVQRSAIEAGLQFIPELPARPLKQRNDKRTGLILAGIGVAAAVPLALIGQLQIAAFGLAPVILGAVYVVVGTFLPSPAASK